ncbi:HlyC/CorC family transporter [Kribbella sandramycini]|uniref:CBS domain containing-hemolysin-like protein n=1 Tax=Kribbella sandramycini TaxID=60450 RepID=A0A7Y4L5M9_9ACTN|nr:hemolysin family protein [Kribbella sandramycini]MBB6567133.1 CBS domain containing-hemolysin-like protein [Kribbella sandramycini]NOL44850.1 HlyC/CorC family transporter [Kribbella sandramycini]
MSTTLALLISLGLLAANGFFVAAEFALVASKRHRLEEAAAAGSRSARSAIAGISELSLMLAGAQLGITLCTLGLGSLSEPAVAHLLHPLFELVHLPEGVGHVIALIIAVGGIGLLHVLLGEMAPKSWAISNPERAAQALAMPFRGFTTLVRPLLLTLNGIANLCLRLIGVTPQNELASAHGPDELRLLIDSSREHGTLEAPEHDLLTAMLALQNITIAQVMTPIERLVTVPYDASARDVELTSRREGRSRLAVVTGPTICGIVHVRDAVRATTTGGTTLRAADLMTAPLNLAPTTPVATAIRTMRDRRSQLAVVCTGADPLGVVALEDLLEQVIGEFDDETDPIITAAAESPAHRAPDAPKPPPDADKPH